MHGKGFISIWFFIGVLLLIYGVVILCSGIYDYVHPPARTVVLAELHVQIWWGALLLLIGAFYSYHFRPGREEKE